ncbi:LysM peptidoglycan-binding domain-containing protein [Alicyclobacillus sp.]|uniref:LysM peptidoglycan-binding domain-containing protein n=1 Tax=Alicyclobacillus sp. TaxID=61169 RepID=UPI0025C4AB77|nr:LysM peptidoglycan-binding domain-containing protein [Alicyclobacillus sp.]MCL6516645.1 LysM peptidoglycan-binding domain-containing protein [Alicyclobacillus sp.]
MSFTWKNTLCSLGAAVTFVAGTPTAMASVVTVGPGDSLWTIARSHQVSLTEVVQANPNVDPNRLPVGARVVVPDRHTYVVRDGDSLWTIANQHHVSVQALQQANPWVVPSNLPVGATLNLPANASTTSSNEANSKLATSDNLYWMAHIIHAEAGGEPLNAKIAVGDVVLHRMQDPAYPDTVKGVVFQVVDGHYQFEPVMNGYIYTTPDAESIQAAEAVLRDGRDLVPGAMVFYNPAQTPAGSWVWTRPVITRLGHLNFAR